MATSLPLASTSVPKGNWYFKAVIYCNSKTPASTIFKVELYKWDPITYDYNLVGTLYIKSDANPATDEGAKLYYNIGGLPASSESFMIVISRV
ncbi:MAG: hypothetical protein QXY96_07040 [Candidatus Methanomethylicaceae archaeon]